MTSRNPTTNSSSSRNNNNTTRNLNRPNSSASAASTSHQPTRGTTTATAIPNLPPPSSEEQRQRGNSFYQKALRAGHIHGSSSHPSASTLATGEDARMRGSRGIAEGSLGTRAKWEKNAAAVAATEARVRKDMSTVHEDNEIVKRDANGDYESFLTVGVQVYQDALLGGEGMGEGPETEEDPKQRDRELLDLYRSQRGQQIDLAEFHAANMAYLRERTNALDDDNWMFESEDPTRDRSQ